MTLCIRKSGRYMFLALWFIAHLVVATGVLSGALQWWFTPGLIVFTIPYVLIVFLLDRWLRLGGVDSYLQIRRSALPVAAVRHTPRRHRSALANQTTAITTGFAAILLFGTVSFQGNPLWQQSLNTEWQVLLTVVACGFCLACVANLTQLLMLRLLDRRELVDDDRGRLRRRLRLLTAVSWHSLITPIVLLLVLLEWPLPALLLNCLYGLCLYCYYFSLGAGVGQARAT